MDDELPINWYKNKINNLQMENMIMSKKTMELENDNRDLQKKVMKLEVIDKTKGTNKLKLFAIILVVIFIWFIFM